VMSGDGEDGDCDGDCDIYIHLHMFTCFFYQSLETCA
jgi:hypothetical protein